VAMRAWATVWAKGFMSTPWVLWMIIAAFTPCLMNGS